MKNFNKKKWWHGHFGVTLIEIMLVIAIMAIVSAGFLTNIKRDRAQELKKDSEQLVNDLKRWRNLVSSKTAHQFVGSTESKYPVGGYGIVFDGRGLNPQYFIYADNGTLGGFGLGDEVVYGPVVLNELFSMANNVDGSKSFYFAMVNDSQVDTTMAVSPENKYILRLRWPGPGYPDKGIESIIRIGEQSNDGRVFFNFGANYQDFIPDRPDPGRDGGDLD